MVHPLIISLRPDGKIERRDFFPDTDEPRGLYVSVGEKIMRNERFARMEGAEHADEKSESAFHRALGPVGIKRRDMVRIYYAKKR